jgi:nitroreductase
MDFYDVTRGRYSCRAYRSDPVDEPIVLTPLGHPADAPRPKERKPIGALVRRW